MQIRVQIIVGAILLFVFGYLIRMIRKRSLEIKYALSWFGVLVILFIIDLFPGIMSITAGWVGIEVPSNMLFILGFCFLIFLTFTLTVTLSKQSTKNKTLTQEIALLKKRMEELEKQ